jgi:hypothetical protein
MHDAHDIPELDAGGLRRFALQVGGTVALLFGLLLPWLLGASLPLWPWLVGGALIAWGLVAPGTLGPVYRGWMRFGLLLNRVVSPLVLGIVFLLVVTPIGVIRRLAGADSVPHGFDRDATTYRRPSSAAPPKSMERPF